MNIKTLHTDDKPVSTRKFFSSQDGKVIALQIKAGGLLKEHTTPVPATLICIEGAVIYENEQGARHSLMPGDYVEIPPLVKHWVSGIEDSQLLLML